VLGKLLIRLVLCCSGGGRSPLFTLLSVLLDHRLLLLKAFLFILHLSYLLIDLGKDLVGTHIIELSEGCVDPFGILEGNFLAPVALVDPPWLPSEDDIFHLQELTLLAGSRLHLL